MSAGWLLPWALLVGLVVPPAAGAAERVLWVPLPPAAPGAPALGERWPVAPAPTPRALARRAARGDAARIARLSRDPDPGALAWIEGQGIRIRRVSRWLGAASVVADEAQARALAARFGGGALRPVAGLRTPPVEPALAPRPVALPRRAGVPDYGPSADQLTMVEVDRLHELGLSGAGVSVLVLDTGFTLDHPAFASLRLLDQHDFVQGDDDPANGAGDIPTQHNHGTGVLGTLAALAPGELVGPAHGAGVLLAKTEHVPTETHAEEDHFIAALEWGEALGADLFTASLGYVSFDDGTSYSYPQRDGDTTPLAIAVDAAAAMGLPGFVAMGNGGPSPNSIWTPADADSVIAVGSVDADSSVSSFSSRGPAADGRTKPDVVARGRATWWVRADGGYGAVSGTSVACPIVAGVGALLLEAHPGWGPGELYAALRGSASQAGAPDDDRGFGLVRGRAALHALGDPVHPLPFALLAPADSASGGAGTTFAWRNAVDFQGDLSEYRLHFSSSAAFDDTVALYSAGPDTTLAPASLPAGSLHWRVVARDAAGHERASPGRAFQAVADTGTSVAGWMALRPDGRRPATPPLAWRATLARPARLRIELFDLAGRRVAVPFDGDLPADPRGHPLAWDGRDARGGRLASGVYLLRATATDRGGARSVQRSKLTLLR